MEAVRGVALLCALMCVIAGTAMDVGDHVSPAASGPTDEPGPARWSTGQDDAAHALLQKSRGALGGSAALDAVKSLQLIRHDHTTLKILFPDRWQSISQTPWGNAITTLDGDHWWTRTPKLPERLAGKAKASSRSPADAAAGGRHRMAGYSLKYLLRVPSAYQGRYAGEVAFGPITGRAVEFTGSDGYWISMIFDSSTGRPKAQVTRIQGGDPKVHGTHLIEELRDYRPAGNILVPFEIAEYRIRAGKTESLPVWRFTITVNPRLEPSDFREGSVGDGS